MMEPEEICDAYEELVNFAASRLRSSRSSICARPDFDNGLPTLSINGAKATISWREASAYDRCDYTESHEFPTASLSMTDHDFAIFDAAQLTRDKAASEEYSRKYQAEREAEERKNYLRLRAKFEANPS